MHRRPLLERLHAYARRHPVESETVQRLIAFVEEYPTCFERSLPVGHITGSAWVVNKDGTEALFTHHRKLGAWLQLGGHADGDADVPRVALREAAEESGLTDLQLLSDEIFDVDIHAIPARGHEPAHFHYDVRYVVQATGSHAFRVGAESHNLAWIPVADVLAQFEEESILRMARKWQRRQRSVQEEA